MALEPGELGLSPFRFFIAKLYITYTYTKPKTFLGLSRISINLTPPPRSVSICFRCHCVVDKTANHVINSYQEVNSDDAMKTGRSCCV